MASTIPTGIQPHGLVVPGMLDADEWARLAAAFQRRQDGQGMDSPTAYKEALAEAGIRIGWKMLTNRGWLPCNEDGKLLNA